MISHLYFKILIILVIGMLSCRNDKKVNNVNNIQNVQTQNEKLKSKLFNTLRNDLNVSYLWDTLDFEYTISYNNVISSNLQLLDRFYIIDILNSEDNTLKLLINSGKYYFELDINEGQMKILLNSNNSNEYIDILSNDRSKDLVLLVKINKIFKKLKSINTLDRLKGIDFDIIETEEYMFGIGNLVKIYQID